MPMTRSLLVRGLLGAATAVVATVAGAVPAYAASGHRPTLPDHVFAPYFQSYNGTDPAVISRASGAKYLTMAFLQTQTTGSCDILWNGDPATPVAPSEYGSQIAAIRAAGGDVVPSFGGYAADSTATEIADSCTNVSSSGSLTGAPAC